MLLVVVFLPETGTYKAVVAEKLRLNKDVFKVSLWGMAALMFLITFTTNIAMHISGSLAGDSAVTGMLTGRRCLLH